MAEITVHQAIDIALQHQKAGRSAQAEDIFRQLQNVAGDNPDALQSLGVSAFRAGLGETSLRIFRRVVALRPDMAEAHNGIGVALRGQGNMPEALAAFERAAACNPEHVEYQYNVGSMLRSLGRSAEAIELLKQVIARAPKLFAAHYEMARALHDSGRLTEAIDAYRRAIAIEPAFGPAFHHLGVSLGVERRIDEAIEALRRAAVLEPKNPTILVNLGHALHDAKQYEAGIEAYMRSIELQPADPRPQMGIGNILVDLDRRDEAIGYFERAIQVYPPYMAAYSNLAQAIHNLGRANEAIAILRQVVKTAPDTSVFHGNLLFAMHLSDTIRPEEILDESRRWEARCADPLASFIPIHQNERSADRMLRVGYVSGDLRGHPVGMFLLPILENHDRHQFHVTCYSNFWLEDAVTARMRAATAAWHTTVDWSDERLAGQIVEDRIDILVDLSQHTAGNRMLVFARQTAPVQITYLGYPGTTGLKTFDARLGDVYIDPPGQTERFYTEPIERLPESYWCFSAIADAPPVAPPPAGQAGYITFGCMNKLAKSSPSAMRTWAAILKRVPRSRLVMSAPPGAHRQRILDIFRAEGVEVDRIELISKQLFRDYLAVFHRIDIGLDPFPYNGGTTTCQALWMGVPVITLAGTAGVQRSGVSLLSNAGLPELVAQTPEQYVQIAVDLAGDLPRLSAMRENMRERMSASPLMDVPRFVENLEAIYRRLWRQWCAQP